jgi:hypothetical protein
MYFADGATSSGYINGLCQVVDDMMGCADVGDYEGCDYDDNGDVVQYDDNDNTGVIVSYNSETKKWTIGDADDPRYYGQSTEIVDALMLTGLLTPDAGHDENINKTAMVIGDYIKKGE